MEYRMFVNSVENTKVYNSNLGKYIEIILGHKYIYDPANPTTKKERENKGRVVEILGFSHGFCGDAIVRYQDTNRRGRVNPCSLIPFIEE